MELKRVRSQRGMCQIPLLIVPYGIETTDSKNGQNAALSFNRTLWN